MEEPDLNQVCLTPSQELFLLDCRIMVAWWTPLGLRDLRTKFPYIFSSCQSSQPSLTPSLHMTYTSDAFYWMRINHLPSFYINYTSISKRKKGKKKRQEGSELPDVQVDLEKAEEPDIKLPTSVVSSKKQESSRKTSMSSNLNLSISCFFLSSSFYRIINSSIKLLQTFALYWICLFEVILKSFDCIHYVDFVG